MPPSEPDRSARPFDLSRLGRDDGQELREAVCDALIERTRRAVSGEGQHGDRIFGARPSKVLSSGFLVPRLSPGGDEESSDIQIPVHGLDCRIGVEASGEIRVRPSFCVYVRALPDAREVFDPVRKLRPKATLNEEASQRLREMVAARMRAREGDLEQPADQAGRKGKAEGGGAATPLWRRRRELRQAVTLECYRELNIVAPGMAVMQDAEEDGRTEDGAEGQGERITFQVDGGGDLRIPDEHSVTYEIPEKYVRIPVPAEDLVLPLPHDRAAWAEAVERYTVGLNAAVQAAYRAWVDGEDGRQWAWRDMRPRSSHFWSEEGWNNFLAEAREAPVNFDRLHPNAEMKMVAKATREPLDPSVLTVRLAIENHRRTKKDSRQNVESGIFQVRLVARVPQPALRRMTLERVKRSYHLSGFLTLPAMGLNGGVGHREEDGWHVLETTWAPRFVLPRMRQTDGGAVPVAYEDLSSPETDVGALRKLPAAMRDWIKDLEDDPRLFDPAEPPSEADRDNEETRFREDLAAWKAEADRIELGVALLERSRKAWQQDRGSDLAKPYRAWLMTNLAFKQANPARGKREKPGWRLFQLGFILAHIPTLASRIPGYDGRYSPWDGRGERTAHIAAMAEDGRFFDAAFDEEAASLLYMSAGGGKSEAFFGTLTFALFVDRLRGKLRGVTAMIHYPLRLLTLQQAQRLARVMAQAELVRARMRLGGAPFELGFWVGSTNTPNQITTPGGTLNEDGEAVPDWRTPWDDEERLRKDRPAYAAAAEAWNKLPECPFCRAATVLRRFPEHLERLGIVCTEEGRPEGAEDGPCPWNRNNRTTARPEPLPFLLVDADIYRRAPSVLLGTVDKLALLGNHPNTVARIGGMFGLARLVETNPAGAAETGLLHMPLDARSLSTPKDGLAPVSPAYEGGQQVFLDPVPSLVIQDEMHLLEESLGTFGGIFETGLLAWLREIADMVGEAACRAPGGDPRMPHFIGATATASDVRRQVDSIYRRDVVQFPHPGPKLYDSFYTRLADFQGEEARSARTAPTVTPREQEVAAPWARVYVSLLTNGRPHTSTSISILSAYACGITRLLRDLGSGEPDRQEGALEELLENLSAAPFHERRRAALERLRGNPEMGDILASLVDLHRIKLCYVTDKKGGDQILSALARQAEKDHASMGADYEIGPRFDMELISGGVDIKTIQNVIKKAERRFDIGAEDIRDTLRCIVATSAISHGVDVAAFNAMAFAGMPSDIAEYIQASSRVGRTHVGFSMLIPTPQNRRDRFIVEVHEAFHRFLERMIAPPAIERWADKAIARTVPSLVQTFFAGVHHQRMFSAAAAGAKASVPFPSTVPLLKEEMSHRTKRGAWDECYGEEAVARCVAFVKRAVGLGDSRFVPSRDHYEAMLKREIDEIVKEVTSGKYGSDLYTFWHSHHHDLNHPMSSLRDVDEAGEIRIASSTPKLNIKQDRAGAAMALIRNRRPGKRSASGETQEGGKGEE